MKLLSPSGFNRAKESIYSPARPLERRLFAYRFESGTADDVKAELARFQNDCKTVH